MDWYETFKQWAKPPSETEEKKASNASSMINDAVRSTGILRSRNFSVYPTGSYPNNTNIRLGSDVDVAIVLKDVFYVTLPHGYTMGHFDLSEATSYGLAEFRNDVWRALREKFGDAVTQGTKTFDIQGNSYRLPADATPFLEHREYTGARNPDGSWQYFEGVELRPLNDPHRRVINWHTYHYDHGVARNTETRRRFKRIARILKRLRLHMLDSTSTDTQQAARAAASFLLESLTFNAADRSFNKEEGSYYQDVKAVMSDLWGQLNDPRASAAMMEVNRRKRLFGDHQGWTLPQAQQFIRSAWNHVGFS